MSALNRIESVHIQQLKPHELVTLLRILLYAEAKHRRASVHVPLEINVSDGGEDGRWIGELEPDEFIPDKFSLYQVKAGNLGPADCKTAVADGGRLKPALNEVLTANGCYVFFCGHPYVQTTIDRKIDAAKEAIAAVGGKLTRADQVRFLDANKIAAWTNQHASSIAYVGECCQLHQDGNFRTWKDWSHDPVCCIPRAFESNDQLRWFMTSLREHLMKPGSIARITGLSGLGKTRLALETLSPPVDSTDIRQASLSDTAVYIDLEHAPEATLGVISQFASAGLSGTVVVDNCSLAKHLALEQIAGRDGSKISLLTLDYEPEPSRPGILHIALTPEVMRDVVLGILKQFPGARHLSEAKLDHIASFAQGFPQIATLMAEAGDTVDLSRLDRHLIAQRILWGRGASDDRAKQIMCSLSLFTHVGFDGEVKLQRDFVRTVLCANLALNDRDFDRLLQPFVEKRILQKAGNYVMVTPAPLAVALAADWWRFARADELGKLIPQIEACGLTKFFCQRVQQLHFSPNARSLAAQLCGDTGPLCDAEVLNTELGSELFRALVELNPAATMDCLWRLFGTKGREELLRFDVGRRNLVWALEKLCWSKETFVRGATLLLAFGAAENENWANNATAQFKQLFQLYLGGTQMPASERLAVIENGLASGCEFRRRICIEALGTALQGGHFSRSGGVEVRGSGLPEQDWEPKTNRDIGEYWLRSVRLLKAVILEGSGDSPLAKKTLGEHLRTVLIPPLLEKLETDFREIATAERSFWPEASQSIHDAIEYSHEQTPESLEKLEQWLRLLIPEDIELRLQLVVSNSRFLHREGPDGKHVDVAAETAEHLADNLIHDGTDLAPFLPQLLQGDQSQAFPFGARIGEKMRSPERLVAKTLDVLRTIDPTQRNPTFLAALLYGVKKPEIIEKTLDEVANDDRLVDLLASLTRTVNPNRRDLERVITAVVQGRILPQQLRHLAYGSVFNHMEPQVLTQLFAPLIQSLPESRNHIFELLSMYVYHSDERWKECRATLRGIAMSPSFLSSLAQTMDGYHWQEAVSKLLTEARDEELAIEVTRQIIEGLNRNDQRYGADPHQRSVLRILFSQYPQHAWPLVAAQLASKSYFRLKGLVESHGFNDRETSILWSVPQELMVAWVNENSQFLPRLLDTIALFTVDDEGEYHWHPLVLALLNRDLDREAIGAVWSNLFSYGSSGSRVPYVEKRIRLLKELGQHPNATVRNMADTLIAALEKDRERFRKDDEEFSAGII